MHEKVNRGSSQPTASNGAQDDSTDRIISISFVCSLGRASGYLAEFLDSIREQSLKGVDLECVFIGDGSPETEPAAEMSQAWLASMRVRGQVVREEQSGIASQRNAGLQRATGDWVSFPDPNDLLAPNYLSEMAKFIRSDAGAAADVLAAKMLFHVEETGKISNSHPLRFKFDSRPQSLDLLGVPHAFHTSVSSAFVRRSSLEGADLHFNENLRSGAGAILLAQVFALAESPRLGVVSTAEYYRRKQSPRSSVPDHPSHDPMEQVDLLKLGYLPLAHRLHSQGQLEEWFGHQVLYELGCLFRKEQQSPPLSANIAREQKLSVLELTRELLALLDPAWIHTAIHPALTAEIRTLWEQLRKEGTGERKSTVASPVRASAYDAARQLIKFQYFTTRPDPSELIYLGGKRAEARYQKTRRLEYFDQEALYERIVWMPATGWFRIKVDGRLQPISYTDSLPKYALFKADYLRQFESDTSRIDSEPRHETTKSMSTPRPRRNKLTRAWLFMDRTNIARDNAEHLYRYVRRHRPDVNAWFVLERESADWSRLRGEGYRLVEFRSSLHERLLLTAEHVISSHADVEMTNPLPSSRYRNGKRPWTFTFLQHGVTKDNISRWLNHKSIDTLITATQNEYDSFVGNMTPYAFTPREVVLTGFPRHDSLLEKVDESNLLSSRDYLLVAPTWRDGLLTPKSPFSARRAASGIATSNYIKNWSALLNSLTLREFAQDRGLSLIFLPHPQMQDHVDNLMIPPWFDRRSYADDDVQILLAQTKVLVTDYSSLTFDVAYAGMPTVYFQFDLDEIFSGLHTYTKGYFDYDENGFGPVGQTVSEVLDGLQFLFAEVDSSSNWPSRYRERIDNTFTFRDGRCNERTLRAIMASRPGADVATISRKGLPRLRGIVRRALNFVLRGRHIRFSRGPATEG